jgi:ribosome-binding protein aMBF1 (putative translation factor)
MRSRAKPHDVDEAWRPEDCRDLAKDTAEQDARVRRLRLAMPLEERLKNVLVAPSFAHDLRAARLAAGLSQVQLAKRLRRSQTLVSLAENGRVSVGERYIRAVLKACGLPPDWRPSIKRVSRTRARRKR